MRRRRSAQATSAQSRYRYGPPTRRRPAPAPLPRPAFAAAPPSTRRRAAPAGVPPRRSRAVRELREIRLPLLHVRVAPLLGLLAHVIEEGRVTGELLDSGQAVAVGVEPGLEQSQRERAHLEHAVADRDGLLLEALERDDSVDKPPSLGRLRVVLLAEEPDLLGTLQPDGTGEQPRPVTGIE